MYKESIMQDCIREAEITSSQGLGGPFGSAVVLNGTVISMTSNSVLTNNDPTAHAEMNAIRGACKILGTYDLSDCELYATGFPCPMCLGAIMWAGIKKVYVSGMLEDAESIGFKDKFIYETIDKLNDLCYTTNNLDIEFHDRNIAQELYQSYEQTQGTIY